MVIVHGGAAGDIGRILKNVTLAHLLRMNDRGQWAARRATMEVFDRNLEALLNGDVKKLAENEARDWLNRISIVPDATNPYIEELNRRLKRHFGGNLYSTGDSTGAAGGRGHVYFVNPDRREEFKGEYLRIARELKAEMAGRFPISADPTVYNIEVNDKGIQGGVLTEEELRQETDIIPSTKEEAEIAAKREKAKEDRAEIFNRLSYEDSLNKKLQQWYKDRKIGLKKNRTVEIEDAKLDDTYDPKKPITKREQKYRGRYRESIAKGEWFRILGFAGMGSRLGPTSKTNYPIFKIGMGKALKSDFEDIGLDFEVIKQKLLHGDYPVSQGENEGELIVDADFEGLDGEFKSWFKSEFPDYTDTWSNPIEVILLNARENRTFGEIKAANTLYTRVALGGPDGLAEIPLIAISSYNNEVVVNKEAREKDNYGLREKGLYISPGTSNIGFRYVPTEEDLREQDRLKPPEETARLRELRKQLLETRIENSKDREGEVYDPLSGDPFDALTTMGFLPTISSAILSGALGQYFEDHPNGKYAEISNTDNPLADMSDERG